MANNSNVTTLEQPTTGKTAAAKTAVEGGVLKPVGAGSGVFSGKRSKINIAMSKEDGGKDAVFVSVEGVAFQIPRGKTWDVPREVADVLDNAVEFTYDRDGDGNTSRTESPRYAVSRIDVESAA